MASKLKGSTVKPDWVREMSVPLGRAASERMKAVAPVRTVPLAAPDPPVDDGNSGDSMVRVDKGLDGLARSTRSIRPGVLEVPPAVVGPPVTSPPVRKTVDPANAKPEVPPCPLSSTATLDSDWLRMLLSMANCPRSDAA